MAFLRFLRTWRLKVQKAWLGKYSLSAATALTTLLVYIPALHNEFVNWDDDRYIFENLHIRSLGAEFFAGRSLIFMRALAPPHLDLPCSGLCHLGSESPGASPDELLFHGSTPASLLAGPETTSRSRGKDATENSSLYS